jgi:DUF4097 and DUF4098 domain-containing protein YvlB
VRAEKYQDQLMRNTLLYFAILSTLAVGGFASAAGAAEAPQNQTISADDGEKDLAQTWSVAGDARVEIDNVRGMVVVSGWDQNQVQLSGSLGHGSRLEVSGDAQHLALRVKGDSERWFGNHGPASDTTLTLKVPRAAALKVGVVSADASVDGVSGKALEVSAVSGKLTLTSDAPQVDINSVSGDVLFGANHASKDARVHLQTVSGDITAHGLGGRVKLETVSGDISLDGGDMQELETGTVSGDAKLQVTPTAHARFALESMSGDIRLHLPSTLSAHLQAQTFSGDIGTDFGAVNDKEFGGGSNLDVHLGDGDASIKADTFSGEIELRKR